MDGKREHMYAKARQDSTRRFRAWGIAVGGYRTSVDAADSVNDEPTTRIGGHAGQSYRKVLVRDAIA